MSKLEDLPLQEMQDVDWNKLTEEQAARFGLSLGIYNDAVELRDRARSVFMSRVSALISGGVVGLVLLTWSDPKTAIVGVCISLGVGCAHTLYSLRKASSALEEAKKSLQDDVSQMPRG